MSVIMLSSDESDTCSSPLPKIPEELNVSNLSEMPSTSASTSSASSCTKKVCKKRISPGGTVKPTKTKSIIALEREERKQKAAAEKVAKLAAIEANKIYKPGECMKYMHIEVHPALLGAWYMSDVTREVCAAGGAGGPGGARVAPASDMFDPHVVLWSRAKQQTLDNNRQLGLNPARSACNLALYIATSEEVSSLISRRELTARVGAARGLAGVDEMVMVAFNMNECFGPQALKRKTANSNRTPLTEIEFEMAVVDLLVEENIDTIVINSSNELAMFIVQMTKAIAEAPHKLSKRACDEQAEFYMRGDNKNCVAIDKDGNGVSGVWQQMISVLPQSSLETARAVCARYTTPRELCQALQSSNGILELSEVGVSRSGLAGAKRRRLGPERARKIGILFTETDGRVLVE